MNYTIFFVNLIEFHAEFDVERKASRYMDIAVAIAKGTAITTALCLLASKVVHYVLLATANDGNL